MMSFMVALALATNRPNFPLFNPAVPTQADPGGPNDLTITPQHQKEIDSDIKLGAQYDKEVRKQYKVSTNKEMQARVDRIGAILAAAAAKHHLVALWGDKRYSDYPFHFTVIQGDDVNAFSLPGGYVYIFEGLIKYTESDDELAGVMGHEMSHVLFRHIPTLEKEENKLSLLTIPLILGGLISHSSTGESAVALGSLLNQAEFSGWSQQAEEAADFGGMQLLRYTTFNPLGILTTMERFARDERLGPATELGIFRDHPPSPERAQKLIDELTAAGIPIRRSEVSTSYRAMVKPADNGVVAIWFNGHEVYGFAGDGAVDRADAASKNLNEFFDQMPAMFDARLGDNGDIIGLGKVLFTVEPSDAAVTKMTVSQLSQTALKQIRAALFNYAFRVWQGT